MAISLRVTILCNFTKGNERITTWEEEKERNFSIFENKSREEKGKEKVLKELIYKIILNSKIFNF